VELDHSDGGASPDVLLLKRSVASGMTRRMNSGIFGSLAAIPLATVCARRSEW
jgi:hypothetical protein